MKIRFERSGGLAGLTLRTVVDSSELHPKAAHELAKLVAGSGLTTSSGDQSVNRTADGFSYSLSIDDGERCSAFAGDETSLPESVRPLVAWLIRRSRG